MEEIGINWMMHLKRWLTGIVAVPVLIYVIGPGPRWLFHLLIFLAALTALIEFYGMTAREGPRFVRWSGFVLCFCLFFSLFRDQILLTLFVICLWAIVPMSYVMFTYDASRRQGFDTIGRVVLGAVWICVPLSLLVLIHRFPRGGNHWIFFLLSVVFLSDTGAFYFGRILGRHKLFPAVSPGKTWEGAVGGLVSSLLPAFLFPLFSPIFRLSPAVVVLCAGLSVSGQLGDLAESMMKRYHGVKDSGGILPGHGGVLDRIDGILFAVPVLYGYLTWFVF